MISPLAARADTARKIFGGLLLAVCLGGLGGSFWLAGQTSPRNKATVKVDPAIETARTTERLEQETRELRDEARKLREESVRLQSELDGERREADGFRWLLTAIVGLGALYGLFQGLYSYFNVQGFNSQADRIIKDLDLRKEGAKNELEEFQKRVQAKSEGDFEKFRRECEIRYPLFTGLEAALGRTAALLASRFGSSAVSAELYRPIDKSGLEEIYYYERSAAALEYMGFARGVDHIQILRGFSSFYLEKHRKDHADQHKPGQPTPDPRDLIRARFYLDRARTLYGADYRVSNALGSMELRGGPNPNLEYAKAQLLESIALQPHQQCARYDLAWILDEQAHLTNDQALYEQAAQQLRLAVLETNWEDSPIPARVPDIHYNLACAVCRLATFPLAEEQKKKLLAEGFDALLHASAGPPEVFRSFNKDRAQGGALAILNESSAFAAKMNDLAAAIAAP